MSVREPDFQGDVAILAKIHYANPNLNAELAAVSTALASDPTTHDWTIETPPAGLRLGIPTGVAPLDRFTNDLLLLVNAAKGGNLPTASIIAAIDSVAGVLSPPGVVDVPYASASAKPPIAGTVLSCTTGNWVGTPTSYAYQWKKDGVNIGTNANAYTLLAGDVGGHQFTCVVTASNATPPPTAAPPSNAVAT